MYTLDLTLTTIAPVSPLLDLCGRLAVDEGSATEGAEGVVDGGALDAVPLPGFSPQNEDGKAGK